MTWESKYSLSNGNSKYINEPENISQEKQLWSEYRICKQVIILLPLNRCELGYFLLVSSFSLTFQDKKGCTVKNSTASPCIGVEPLETRSNMNSCSTCAYESTDTPLTGAKGVCVKPRTSGTRRIK